eukprot:CAMPEP_0178457116 /NCGR_PEP_ID=MMETSP0689_2-20121128/46848_1 /TAXON_ID=160604 /ORGANISM="Amphidinium massartii, Strain CS-259" /LENGTH=1409 /DNA_ID=CAMNT_0020083351 /DNA_START=36 /DNA_END=4264 /DNA_ORIENTATION=-
MHGDRRDALQRDLDEIHRSYVANGGAARSVVGMHRQLMFATQPEGQLRASKTVAASRRSQKEQRIAAPLVPGRRDVMLLKDGLDMTAEQLRSDAARMRAQLNDVSMAVGESRRAQLVEDALDRHVPPEICKKFHEQQQILVEQRRVLEELKREHAAAEVEHDALERQNRNLYHQSGGGAEVGAHCVPPAEFAETHRALRAAASDLRLSQDALAATWKGWLVEILYIDGLSFTDLLDADYEIRITLNATSELLVKQFVAGPCDPRGVQVSRSLQLNIDPQYFYAPLTVELALRSPTGRAATTVPFAAIGLEKPPQPMSLELKVASSTWTDRVTMNVYMTTVPPHDIDGVRLAHTRATDAATLWPESRFPGPELPASAPLMRRRALDWERQGGGLGLPQDPDPYDQVALSPAPPELYVDGASEFLLAPHEEDEDETESSSTSSAHHAEPPEPSKRASPRSSEDSSEEPGFLGSLFGGGFEVAEPQEEPHIASPAPLQQAQWQEVTRAPELFCEAQAARNSCASSRGSRKPLRRKARRRSSRLSATMAKPPLAAFAGFDDGSKPFIAQEVREEATPGRRGDGDRLLLGPPAAAGTLADHFTILQKAVQDGTLGRPELAQNVLNFAVRIAEQGVLEQEVRDEEDVCVYAALLIDAVARYKSNKILSLWVVEALVQLFNYAKDIRLQFAVPICDAITRVCLRFSTDADAELHDRLLAALAVTMSPDCHKMPALVNYVLDQLDRNRNRLQPLTVEHALAVLCVACSPHRILEQVKHGLLVLRGFKSDVYLATRAVLAVAELYDVLSKELKVDSPVTPKEQVDESSSSALGKAVRISLSQTGEDVHLVASLVDLYPKHRKMGGAVMRALAKMCKVSPEHLRATIQNEIRILMSAQLDIQGSRSVNVHAAEIICTAMAREPEEYITSEGAVLMGMRALKAFPRDAEIAWLSMEALRLTLHAAEGYRKAQEDKKQLVSEKLVDVDFVMDMLPAVEVVRIHEGHKDDMRVIEPLRDLLTIYAKREIQRNELAEAAAAALVDSQAAQAASAAAKGSPDRQRKGGRRAAGKANDATADASTFGGFFGVGGGGSGGGNESSDLGLPGLELFSSLFGGGEDEGASQPSGGKQRASKQSIPAQQSYSAPADASGGAYGSLEGPNLEDLAIIQAPQGKAAAKNRQRPQGVFEDPYAPTTKTKKKKKEKKESKETVSEETGEVKEKKVKKEKKVRQRPADGTAADPAVEYDEYEDPGIFDDAVASAMDLTGIGDSKPKPQRSGSKERAPSARQAVSGGGGGGAATAKQQPPARGRSSSPPPARPSPAPPGTAPAAVAPPAAPGTKPAPRPVSKPAGAPGGYAPSASKPPVKSGAVPKAKYAATQGGTKQVPKAGPPKHGAVQSHTSGPGPAKTNPAAPPQQVAMRW